MDSQVRVTQQVVRTTSRTLMMSEEQVRSVLTAHAKHILGIRGNAEQVELTFRGEDHHGFSLDMTATVTSRVVT